MVRARRGTLGGPTLSLLRCCCCALLVTATTTGHAQSAGEPPDAPDPAASDGDSYDDTDPSALTDFRPALDPHGTWADDQTYGTVWTPNPEEVGADFQPYDTAGQWDYQDGDYAWTSNFAWGWVCFHYGRWVWAPPRGWMWIPGRTYASAWVMWRLGDDDYPYIGWAPLPPAWVWIGGGATAIGSPQEPWLFTGRGNIFSPSLAAHTVVGAPAAALVPHTKPYAPATPTVGAAGSSYVPATPSVVATPFVTPTPHGPPPSLLGIDPATIQHPPVSARELRARQYAHPSTAQPIGAHPPTPRALRAAPFAGARGGEPQRGGGGRGRR